VQYNKAREYAEDIAVAILEAVGAEKVRAMVVDILQKKEGRVIPLEENLVFNQFEMIMRRMKTHVRGPKMMRGQKGT
jgi:hypothetical protein